MTHPVICISFRNANFAILTDAAEEVAAMAKEWEGREHYWELLPKIGPIEGIVSMEYSADLAKSADADDAPINTERRVIATSSALKRVLVCFPPLEQA